MKTARPTGFLVLAMVVLLRQLAQAEDATAATQPAAPAAGDAAAAPAVVPAAEGFFDAFPIHGYVRSRYQARWTDHASDQDLYETLSLDIGDPERNRVTAYVLGDVSVDLDGNTDNDGYYAFDSARDADDGPAVARLYSCYLDVHRLAALDILRAGRQSIAETPEVSFFDGVRLETEELGGVRLKLGAYGGVPVHLYDGYTADDRIGGAYAQARLWRGNRVRADWQRLEGQNQDVAYSSTVMGFGAWQRVGSHVDLHANYTMVDDEARDILARGTFTHAEWDLRFQGSFYQLFQRRRNTVIETDAFYPILKNYVPYVDYRGMLSKGLGEHVNVDLGMDVRRLSHDEQVSPYNHEFEHYFATLDLLDLLVKGSSISLTEEKWDSADRETEAQGLDVTCPIGAKNTLSAGTAHSLYKYDYYADAERVDVQTYYAKFAHRYSKSLRLSVNYEYEDDGSTAHYNELRCEAICSF